MLEMNTLALETNVLNPHIRASATHMQLATSDFQAELCRSDYIVTATYMYLGNGRYHVAGIQKASRCTTASGCTELVFKAK